jgi:formate C-acetyltransferase
MKLGKQMQFFGARCNLPKLLLIAINGGYDTTSNIHIGPQLPVLQGDTLDYLEVKKRLEIYIPWIAKLYVNTMNVIHYMHDKYCYEKSQMALHDTFVERLMAFGIAGFSVVIDSLSAIKYARVYPVRDENNLAVDFRIDGEFPKYGNDDDRADSLGQSLATSFLSALKKNETYRDAKHTLSILTITSNVVYGKKTGATPDGRSAKEPFAPGANPMHGRDDSGPLASLNSVAKIPYQDICEDGISNTFSIVPSSLGKENSERVVNLTHILDGYFTNGGHHLNVNLLNRETLLDAIERPEEYPALTIRVRGYAGLFN